jgi:alpha-L-arabinofuranosidase
MLHKVSLCGISPLSISVAIATALALLLTSLHARSAEVFVKIDVDKPTVELSPVLYGLFFEDINYSGDGGLYAELVQNRSFEYYPVEGWENNSKQLHPLYAWQKVERDGGAVELKVMNESPLNESNAKYLKMKIVKDGVTGIRNAGFDGIVLKKGGKYDFSVYAKRSQDTATPVDIALESDGGKVLASGRIPALGSEWKKYELTLDVSEDASDASLVLTTGGKGEVMFDMVSLFPQDTFKGRKNGLRKDLAQSLADLKPGFLRFPGGCIVHGQGLANAYRWKDTVGDVAERRPNWNLWGYHQSYGLGFFEFMQLCEDIGATPLPVVPLGVACSFRRPFDVVPMQDLHAWTDDALDLIEFANGPTDSKWGKLRAEMGHSEPFGLRYICLGNEEGDTPEVRERFPEFVEAIRKRYPDIKIVGTSGLGPEIPLFDMMVQTQVYSTDEHYYMQPGWYLDNVHRFDKFDRRKPKVFVGEYASEGNTQFNAVAEAAYLTGVERNADIVHMTCYAPLFAKLGFTQWTKANLIWFNNEALVKTPNYYVQQLFSTNKGDVYLRNTVESQKRASTKKFAGRVGIGTWRTSIEMEKATLNGKPLDFSDWEAKRGDFAATNGNYAQRDRNAEAAVSVAPQNAAGNNDIFQVRARKTGGDEGFLLVFGYEKGDSYYWWNVGGWRNNEHGIERRVGEQSQRIVATRGSIESNRWYDLKVELGPGRIRCYIDGKQIHDYELTVPEVRVSPTFDKSTGQLMVKLVNPAEDAVSATLNLRGRPKFDGDALLTTLAGPAGAVNTVVREAIHPVASTLPAAETMRLDLPATSVQVLRVKVK